jgi:hypothetical protein
MEDEPTAATPLEEAFGFAAGGMAAWMRHLDECGLNRLAAVDLRRDFVAFSDVKAACNVLLEQKRRRLERGD